MADSKEHILAISLNLFLLKNFKEVTMNEIVEKTGLSKGAFYHYFKSKEQVFAEVIEHFYSQLLLIDYSRFSQDSLARFYKEYLELKNEQANSLRTAVSVQGKANHFLLMFDAMKLLPDFKNRYAAQQKEELKAWTKIIHTAKKSGEINSKMPDEQIAKLFIYIECGKKIGYLLMDNAADKNREETKLLWDSLYKELKK